ncbi:hematopoietic prostaglandin D synthase-like [Artemia franciscana]|uniref:glutathione transferase n=1 Tax=Artemia franciscana TaxID=6661 RepID=A0AA88HN38_ARTSF|nr:hypothetical protein QYM36_011289 [Artemia franciscana]
MDKKYKLIYFNVKGKGEVIRLIFTYGKIPYEDVRIESSQWPALKPNTPFGQLPYIEFDGKTLAQSNAIARYLAKQCDLTPTTDWEQAQADELSDVVQDIKTIARPVNPVYEKDEAKRKSLLPDVLAAVTQLLDKVEARLAANTSGWLVGNKISWIDLLFFTTTEYYVTVFGKEVLAKYEHQHKLYTRIKQIPQIAAYLEKRIDTVI